MASSTFAPETGHVPNPSSSSPPPARHLHSKPSSANRSHSTSASNGNNSSISSSNSNSNSNTTLHAHRQNHNSSKLPAFRFADLKKEALAHPGLLPQHLPQQHLPPSPLSPSPNSGHCSPESADQSHDPDSHKQRQQSNQGRQIAVPQPQNDLHDTKTPASPASKPSAQAIPHHPQSSPTRNRASTFQISSSATTTTTCCPASSLSKRPASFPDSPAVVVKVNGNDLASSTSNSTRPHPPPTADPTKDWAQGQRELLLPKTVDTAKTDEKKKSRPPVSFRHPNTAASSSGRAVIPPIRSFRSSGSRKSLGLDMHTRRTSYDSGEEAYYDPNHLDRTLMALEGRSDDDYSQITPPDSAEPMPDNEHTADIFMRIAREDPARRAADPIGSPEDRSTVTRIARSTHTRPSSAAVPSYHASPPQISRRLSDQRENVRNRRGADDRSAQQMSRELNSRGVSKDQPTQNAHAGEDSSQPHLARVSLRPSPITPRTLTFQEPFADGNSVYSRRRPSLTDSTSGPASRTSQYRASNLLHSQARTYNSSPLAPRSSDPHRQDAQQTPETNQGVEGTESSASTAAPSTVWDELDDLKSRIYRLELTGKAPSTSGAAMSRVSDERPPTATTNATTMSASPKRASGTGAAQADASSITSSQKEAQPILFSALSKTRGLVSSDVYSAIESASTEALALSSMMGISGQPGPISSGASTIGSGGSVTDRQLRRKAESICRSLTELCLALTESSSQPKPPQGAPTQREMDSVTSPTATSPTVTSPTVAKFPGNPSHRQPTATTTDQTVTRLNSSPRAGTSLEQRRTSMMGPTALPSPRFAAAPRTPIDAGWKSSLLLSRTRRAGTEEFEEPSGRRSSLLVARARRGGTEEPEEPSGRKSSLLLRTRRAATEEPEEGRKTSLLHARRGSTNDAEDDEDRFRAPSRAATEINGFRAAPREYPTQGPAAEGSALGTSALPRRRFVSSSLNSRATGPSSAVAAPTARRYVDRPTPERDSNSVMEKLAEDRGQRQLSLSQTAMLNRTGSLSRRRNSGIPSLPSPSTHAASYR